MTVRRFVAARVLASCMAACFPWIAAAGLAQVVQPANAAPLAGVEDGASNVPPSARAKKAEALIAAINPAARKLDYEGSFIFQRGGNVQSSHLVHFVEGADGQYQKIDGLDGKPRSVVQHNDDILTFLPDSKTVILDSRKGQDNFPALLSAGSAQVLSVYKASIVGTDRVAGVDCEIVALDPRDAYRFAYRLYIDQRSGLLVRAQTLDSTGNVLEQVAFSQLQIGTVAAASRRAIRSGVKDLAGWKQVRAPAVAVDMEAAGWALDPGVPGFHKLLELRRPMAARDPGLPPVPVDQAVFSDGVTAISLFIEPVDKSDRKPGEGQSGATHLLAEQHGQFWLTLIGEVPEATLRKFAASIQYQGTTGGAASSAATPSPAR